jgi:hypothetical protein
VVIAKNVVADESEILRNYYLSKIVQIDGAFTTTSDFGVHGSNARLKSSSSAAEDLFMGNMCGIAV